jgi:four helix bundle protein
MPFDLADRLINFSVLVLDICECLTDDRAANHLRAQLIRSGTAPALMYGEAQSAESRKDVIHKMKRCLKELKETNSILQIIDKKKYCKNTDALRIGLNESQQANSDFRRICNNC